MSVYVPACRQISPCTMLPSTYIAVNGLAGQRFSQAPQPMHLSVFITGMRISGLSLPSSRPPRYLCRPRKGTICIAPVGQCRAQLPHFTPSVRGMQFSLTQTACPIRIDDFSSAETGRMAPAGQNSDHFVHSGLQ